MCKVLHIVYVLFCFCITSNAQNLVANSDFKDVNICCEMNATCSIEGWFSISSTQPTRIFPTGIIVIDKKHYLGLPLPISIQEHLDRTLLTPLLCQMKKDELYQIKLDIEVKNIELSHLEILFTDTMSVEVRDKPDASIIFKGKEDKPFKRGTYTISQTYTAKGNERYLMIGLFGNNKVNFKIQSKKRGFAFLINHISITSVNHTIDCDLEKAQRWIYNENRRHDFSQICRDDNTNLFPYLIQERIIDSTIYKFISEEDKRKRDLLLEQSRKENKMPPPLPVDYRTFSDPRMKKAIQRKQEEKPIDNVLRNLNFDVDDATLKPLAYKEVARLVVIMYKNAAKNVLIVGYTDNSGSDEHNMKLSVARAKAVSEYLIRKGIDAKRISYEGRGAENPIDNNDTEEGRSNNRRVEFFLKD